MNRAGTITFAAGALLVAAAWGVGVVGLPQAARPVTEVLPELLAVLLLLLAWWFRRGRVALAAVIIAIANTLIRGPLRVEIDGTAAAGLALIGLLLPFNLGLLALTREHPLRTWSTAARLAMVAAQLAASIAVVRLVDAPSTPLRLLYSPETSLLAFLIAGIFTALAFATRRSTFEVAMLWVLAGCAVAVAGGRGAHAATLMLAASQLALLIAVVEDSYRLAYHDPLTDLPARRALDESLRALEGIYSIAMVDVDRFKRFNDRYGHDAGDQALRMVADELLRVGEGGRAFRYGGEEFTVVFPGRPPAATRQALQQLRQAIEGRTFTVRAANRPRKKPDHPVKPTGPIEQVHLTVSIGVAGPSPEHPDPSSTLRAADEALYRAKKRGRNRVVIERVQSLDSGS